MSFDFQDMPPATIVLFSTLYANYLGEQIPFNIQNLLGNMFCLVGQALLTYNAQQQYFQGGPGRCYKTEYRDVNNPFCVNKEKQADDEIFENSISFEEIIKILDDLQLDLSKIINIKSVRQHER